MTVRVVVADDHPVVRTGLRHLLASLDDVQVVAEAATGREAVRETVLHAPDVVVMDLSMPDMDGIQATRELARACPSAAVLVLTLAEDDTSLLSAVRAGARGYLLKGAQQDEIERAIRAVAAGEVVFGPGMAAQVLALIAARPVGVPLPELSRRERAVLELMAGGAPTGAIAARLGITAKTVSNHTASILAKLGARTRADAVDRARAAGLGP